jgi:hypothetical protein
MHVVNTRQKRRFQPVKGNHWQGISLVLKDEAQGLSQGSKRASRET